MDQNRILKPGQMWPDDQPDNTYWIGERRPLRARNILTGCSCWGATANRFGIWKRLRLKSGLN